MEDSINLLKGLKGKYIDVYTDTVSGQLLYITDHAKVRYLERVKSISLTGDTDKEKLSNSGLDTYSLSKEIVSREEEEKILKGQLETWTRNDITLVIKRLAIVTVTKD